MKNKLLFLLMATMATTSSLAQNVRLNGYALGVFDDQVDSYYDNTNYYNGTIKGGFLWGAGMEFVMRGNNSAELIYMRQDTRAPMTYYKGGVKNTNFNLALNYIMLGATKYFRGHNSKLEGFGGLLVGMDAMHLQNPDNGNSSNRTFFAWGARGGVNIWASDKVGLKLQAQLISSVQAAGGGFYFGTGGAGAGISTYSTMYQFGLGGGLVFKLGRSKG